MNKTAGWHIAPVLKSNAYGHGLLEVAAVFAKHPIPFFVVDSPFEAIILKKNGIKTKTLIIGYTTIRNICKFSFKNTSFTITSLDQLAELSSQLNHPKNIHLKIDTGMHRQGISLAEIDNAITIIKKNQNINLEGVCSHLADPGEHEAFTNLQIENWHVALQKITLAFPNVLYKHLAATGAISYRNKIQANVARVGLGLYGINTTKSFDLSLSPVLEMKTVVSAVKVVPKGEFIGYNLTHETKRITKIVTLPIGYAEGVDLRLSNKGFVIINNQACPIIGRVSMNITTVDVTNLATVNRGDAASFISLNPRDINSIGNIAQMCQTIPYEILVHLPQNIRRQVV